MVTPFLGVKFGGSTSIVDLDNQAGSAKTVFGVAGSYLTKGLFGVEGEFALVPGYLDGPHSHNVSGSTVVDLSGNLVIVAPVGLTRGGLRPYAVAGMGVIHAEASDVLDIFRIRRSVPALTLGAGATGLISNTVGVRFDIRHLNSVARDNDQLVAIGKRINYWRFTVGIVRRF